MKRLATATAALVLFSSTAIAQSVQGVPMNIRTGGGCLYFDINGTTYSLPYLGNDPSPPRGGASAIDAKVGLVEGGRTITFTPPGQADNTVVCDLGGIYVGGPTLFQSVP